MICKYSLVIISLFIVTDFPLSLSQDGLFGFHSFPNQQPRRNYMPSGFKIALKRSIERDPFEVWHFKDRFKTMKDLSITPESYTNEVVERTTTKDRMKNVMAKILLGQNIGLTVMGGSISAGGGLINDFSDLRGIYYRVFIDWWQKVIQPYTGSSVILRNLAVGGTGSNYFAFCYKALMRPRDTMDVVFLEFSVNDYMLFRNSRRPKATSLEKLTRQLLSEERSPAVMFVNFIKGNGKVPVCNNLENEGQTTLAWHYGITSFSMRNSLCPNTEHKMFPAMFSSDGNHCSIIAHAQIAMMIINSVRDALLEAIESPEQEIRTHLRSHILPRPIFIIESHEAVPGPLCYTLITPDVTDTFFNPSLFIKEIENKGFKNIRYVPIGFHRVSFGKYNPVPLRTDGFGGWESEEVNSELKLKIDLPFSGSKITYNVVIAFRTSARGGKAEVWLGKYEPHVVVDTFSLFGNTRLTTVADHVTLGSHVLNVKKIRSGKFTLCGVMVGAKAI